MSMVGSRNVSKSLDFSQALYQKILKRSRPTRPVSWVSRVAIRDNQKHKRFVSPGYLRFGPLGKFDMQTDFVAE